MKKLKLVLLVWAVSMSICSAQIIVDEKDINADKSIEYVTIVGADIGILKKKLVIAVDYGQRVNIFEGGDMAVKDSTGKAKIFASMTGALNFFVANGWEYVNSYAITSPVQGGGAVYHYLLRRKP